MDLEYPLSSIMEVIFTQHFRLMARCPSERTRHRHLMRLFIRIMGFPVAIFTNLNWKRLLERNSGNHWVSIFGRYMGIWRLGHEYSGVAFSY